MQRHHGGFTVIEVMLFLAVTGLIMSVLLVGVTTGLNNERYKDAVNSYVNFWQGQYNDVINVNNGRAKDNPCLSGKILSDGTHTDAGRGTSNCTIVGRLIHSIAGSAQVSYAPVYSTVDPTTLPVHPNDTDKQVLASAGLIVDPTSQTYDLGWGTSLKTTLGAPSNFSILIVRMPTTGVLHTYVLSQSMKTPADIVMNGTTNKEYVMCIESAGLVASGRLGVTLQADAVNSSGVLFTPEGTC